MLITIISIECNESNLFIVLFTNLNKSHISLCIYFDCSAVILYHCGVMFCVRVFLFNSLVSVSFAITAYV